MALVGEPQNTVPYVYDTPVGLPKNNNRDWCKVLGDINGKHKGCYSEGCPLNFCVCVAVPTWGVSKGGGTQGPLCHSKPLRTTDTVLPDRFGC